MGIQHGSQRIDGVEQAVQFALLIALHPGGTVPGQVSVHLGGGLLQQSILAVKIAVADRQQRPASRQAKQR